MKVSNSGDNERRTRMPEVRKGFTRKGSYTSDDGSVTEFYVTVNFYNEPVTKPGEVFIIFSKGQVEAAELLDHLAMTISMALQYGVPWNVLYEKFSSRETQHLTRAVMLIVDRVINMVVGMYEDEINVPAGEGGAC